MQVELSLLFSPISHLNYVNNSEKTQKAYTELLPVLTQYQTELGQNEELYRAIKEIYEKEKDTLNQEQKKVLEDIGLDPEHTTPSDIADKISDKSGKISDGTKEFLGRLLENSGIELPSFETNSCDSETYYRNPDCF